MHGAPSAGVLPAAVPVLVVSVLLPPATVPATVRPRVSTIPGAGSGAGSFYPAAGPVALLDVIAVRGRVAVGRTTAISRPASPYLLAPGSTRFDRVPGVPRLPPAGIRPFVLFADFFVTPAAGTAAGTLNRSHFLVLARVVLVGVVLVGLVLIVLVLVVLAQIVRFVLFRFIGPFVGPFTGVIGIVIFVRVAATVAAGISGSVAPDRPPGPPRRILRIVVAVHFAVPPGLFIPSSFRHIFPSIFPVFRVVGVIGFAGPGAHAFGTGGRRTFAIGSRLARACAGCAGTCAFAVGPIAVLAIGLAARAPWAGGAGPWFLWFLCFLFLRNRPGRFPRSLQTRSLGAVTVATPLGVLGLAIRVLVTRAAFPSLVIADVAFVADGAAGVGGMPGMGAGLAARFAARLAAVAAAVAAVLAAAAESEEVE